MPLNSEIVSKFVIEEEELEYTMEIKIKGPDTSTRRQLLLNLSFDVENKFEFYGTPIVETENMSQRFIVIKSIND